MVQPPTVMMPRSMAQGIPRRPEATQQTPK
jgi:hypothetical protein